MVYTVRVQVPFPAPQKDTFRCPFCFYPTVQQYGGDHGYGLHDAVYRGAVYAAHLIGTAQGSHKRAKGGILRKARDIIEHEHFIYPVFFYIFRKASAKEARVDQVQLLIFIDCKLSKGIGV